MSIVILYLRYLELFIFVQEVMCASGKLVPAASYTLSGLLRV